MIYTCSTQFSKQNMFMKFDILEILMGLDISELVVCFLYEIEV